MNTEKTEQLEQLAKQMKLSKDKYYTSLTDEQKLINERLKKDGKEYLNEHVILTTFAGENRTEYKLCLDYLYQTDTYYVAIAFFDLDDYFFGGDEEYTSPETLSLNEGIELYSTLFSLMKSKYPEHLEKKQELYYKHFK